LEGVDERSDVSARNDVDLSVESVLTFLDELGRLLEDVAYPDRLRKLKVHFRAGSEFRNVFSLIMSTYHFKFDS
jgi:hypothetical protein